MIIKSITNFFWKIGKAMEDSEAKKTDTYVSKYPGKWVDKGGKKTEDWQWVEEKVKFARPQYINIFEMEDDYIVTVGTKPRPLAIETLICEDNTDLDIKLKYTKIYYEALGNVVMPTESE